MPLRLQTPARRAVLVALTFLLVALGFVALLLGPADVTAGQAGRVVASHLGVGELQGSDGMADAVVWFIRLPRILSAMLVGAGLSLAGAMLQGLFRNPLADPGLIGVSSGAALGAVTAIIFLPMLGLGVDLTASYGLPTLAMAGAVGITFLIYQLSKTGGRTHVAAMLLTGIAVNAVASAFIGLAVTVFATDAQLRTVTFWTLGSLAGVSWESAGILALLVVPGVFVSLRLARPLNAFLLGEVEASHLGVNTQSVKRWVIVLGSLMVGVTVAFCGIIGFVGLVVPHIIRITFGPDHRLLLPASALLGGITMVVADTFARTVMAPAELQIGILTALLGGPFFLGLLLMGRKKLSV